ncbi:hypothetical protein CcrColossus_gp261 [Caulobacter phage CcrColossus]|uniref:Uncharacterized protein n=1 Tax=Caulobacter phage CcrColossus TaxID=1211640 RepID=K4JSN3_9CAUD|nr:hypothetical protein CcrColossus_gp261 [Caulobacter phage CcrColossus]AFU88131.1 hypothetical protein CcrColossus_gp261 [Caulobacter phage CcrColossus]
MSKTIYTYIVEGPKYGEFPLDMLRRDQSQAATAADQALIDRLAAFGVDKKDLPKRVRVKLTMSSDRYPPNVERWESFGWQVIASNHPRNYGLPFTMDEIAEQERSGEVPAAPVKKSRRETLRDLKDAVVRLEPYVYMAKPTFQAIREAYEACEYDPEERQHALGMLDGVRTVLKTGKTAGFIDGADVRVLITALDLAYDLLTYQDTDYIRSFLGDRPDTVLADLKKLLTMFKGIAA